MAAFGRSEAAPFLCQVQNHTCNIASQVKTIQVITNEHQPLKKFREKISLIFWICENRIWDMQLVFDIALALGMYDSFGLKHCCALTRVGVRERKQKSFFKKRKRSSQLHFYDRFFTCILTSVFYILWIELFTTSRRHHSKRKRAVKETGSSWPRSLCD